MSSLINGWAAYVRPLTPAYEPETYYKPDVTTWATDVVAATAGDLFNMIRDAMVLGDGDHRITCTFASIDADTSFFYSTAIPGPNCYIFVTASARVAVNAKFTFNGPSNVVFHNFGWRAPIGPCVEVLRANSRLGFVNCDIGHHGAGLADPLNYPVGIKCAADTQLYVEKCDFRKVFEGIQIRGGRSWLVDNLIDELADDFVFAQCLNAASHLAFVYSHMNIVASTIDQDIYGEIHPDFIQTGGPTDNALDEYWIQSSQDIYLGQNIAAYSNQGIFMKVEGGPAHGCRLDLRDSILLVTSTRSLTLADRRSTVDGVILAKPPTTGRQYTYVGAPSLQPHSIFFQAAEASDGVGFTPVLKNVLATGYGNTWGDLIPENFVKADHRDASGAFSYQTVFPKMTGAYDTDQYVVTPYAGAIDRGSIRAFVGEQYEPAAGFDALDMKHPLGYGTAGNTFPAGVKLPYIAADGRHPALPLVVRRGAAVNPLAITNLTMTATSSVLTFNFTPPAGASTYLFQIATGTTWGGDRYSSAGAVSGGTYNYTGVSAGVSGQARIFVDGVLSNTATFTMQAAPAITDLTVTTTETTAAHDFTRIAGTVSYTFQRSTDAGATWGGNIAVAANALPAGPYTRTGMTQGTAYQWRVLSDGTPSNVVDEPTKTAQVVTPPPSGTFAGSFAGEQTVPTWPDRTHTASLTATTTGAGTDASPWTMEQAMDATAGMIVGLLPGQWYGTQPAVQTSDLKSTPAFRANNSGTAANPIWFIAQYPAATNTTNRTEIYSGATVDRQGWPAFGAHAKNHVKFVGIYSSMNDPNGQIRDDSGLASIRGDGSGAATGNGIYKCHLDGKPNLNDNNSGVRVETLTASEIADNIITGFSGNTNNAGITVYGGIGIRMHHNQISNCFHALHPKSRRTGYKFYNNRVTSCSDFVRTLVPSYEGTAEEEAWIYNNTGKDIAKIWSMSQSDSLVRTAKIKMFNNTFYNVTTANDPGAIAWSVSPPAGDRDCRFFNNIVHTAANYFGTYQGYPNSAATMADFIKADRNVLHGISDYFNGGGVEAITLTQWQGVGQDVNTAFANPMLTNLSTGDFTLQAGSPAINLGRDLMGAFGPVGGTINAGARPLSSSEVIGIRS